MINSIASYPCKHIKGLDTLKQKRNIVTILSIRSSTCHTYPKIEFENEVCKSIFLVLGDYCVHRTSEVNTFNNT